MSVTDDSRELLNITGGSPVVAECPPTEPITPVAMVQIVPPADPTILEVVTQKIWDQTMNCGEEPPTSAGPLLANFLGTPMVTEDRPGLIGSRLKGPGTPDTAMGTNSPGESPAVEILKRLISAKVVPGSTDQACGIE